jgi:hypothetical protein
MSFERAMHTRPVAFYFWFFFSFFYSPVSLNAEAVHAAQPTLSDQCLLDHWKCVRKVTKSMCGIHCQRVRKMIESQSEMDHGTLSDVRGSCEAPLIRLHRTQDFPILISILLRLV